MKNDVFHVDDVIFLCHDVYVIFIFREFFLNLKNDVVIYVNF